MSFAVFSMGGPFWTFFQAEFSHSEALQFGHAAREI